MEPQDKDARQTAWPALSAVTVAVGVVSGLGGLACGLLLRFVQHIAYDYSLHVIVGGENFLDGVSASSPLRRVLVLCICGAIAGIGWWALYRFGSPLISISKAVKENGPRMPCLSTITHDLLQIVTVALGSPLGRETAPRELGAMLATWLSDRAGISTENRRIMIACGAGAGLAAVYNVPLGGALFTVEVLLGTFALSAVIPALVASIIATLVAWIGLGNVAPYSLPPLSISASLVVWSIVMGPAFGVSAYWFVRATGSAGAAARRNWQLLLLSLLVFPMIGLLAIRFPQLLGNGQGFANEGFDSQLGIGLAAALVLLRLVVILGALRAGAAGGLMTPGLSIGGALGAVLGGLWNHAWHSGPVGAFAVIGAAAFLASSMKMPLTAIILMLEFTRVGHDFLIPLSLAVGGSVCGFQLCAREHAQPVWKVHHEDIPIDAVDPVPSGVPASGSLNA